MGSSRPARISGSTSRAASGERVAQAVSRAHVGRGALGMDALVEAGLAKAHREGPQLSRRKMARGQGRHCGGVDAAAQEHAQGNVRDQAPGHRGFEQLDQLLAPLLLGAGRRRGRMARG